MKKIAVLSALALTLLLPMAAQAENRCGWVQNPTPGNWWLTDRDGQWTLMTQGTYEAPGMDLIGDISVGDYVATNGNYGHACGCMNIDIDDEGIVMQVYSFQQLPISKCENDPALPSPG